MRPATETERLRRNQTAGFASDSTSSGGKLIVLTAPLTETIDHAGYFIQMALACFPDDLDKFIGPKTRVVAVSTHNPLGVTFAAGVYTSIYGSSKEPLNSIYTRAMFDKIKSSPYRNNFQVIVGGSGGWQIKQTNAFEELGVDCVAEGRSESLDTLTLFRKAI